MPASHPMPTDASSDDTTRWGRIADVFDAVADLPPDERTDALDRLCRTPDGAPDPDLRDEVEALLEADEAAQASADTFDLPSAAALVDGDSQSGETIGPWRVLGPLGRGGMGRVDLVERADGAYEQRAALKRLSLVAPSRLRRFLRERQILASLQHPGIARLLDGGVERGEPYLVMEYVRGEPITRHADAHGLGLRDRLALFLQVCDAVAFAHRHLVVHRDLKPSNVLVGATAGRETDGEGAPRVSLLDFGVARLLDADADDPITAEAGAPLTPGYAAPEQIRGGAITTATDVWALGVLLYELVAGRRPFEGDTREAWMESVLRAEPTAPSQVARTQDTPTSPISSRDARRLRGDLDAICLQALCREPEARYASAHDLAADLRRYLADEPVQARRPSALYRARRFARRHRGAVVAAALLALAVAGGVASTLVQARETRAEARRSEATAQFITSLFDAADPRQTVGDTLTARDLLDRGARRIDLELADQPATRADLYRTMGAAYLGIGESDSARAFALRAHALRRRGGLAADPREAVRARLLEAEATYRASPERGNEAIARVVRDARDLGDSGALLDALHLQGMLGASRPSDQTLAALEEALALAKRTEGDESPRVGTLLFLIATSAPGDSRHGSTEEVLREALARQTPQADPHGRAITLDRLGITLLYSGKTEEALDVQNEAIALARTLYGPRNHRVAHLLAMRASTRTALEDAPGAERDAREALAIAERAGSPQIQYEAQKALAMVLGVQGKNEEAIEAQVRSVDLALETFGPQSPIAVNTRRGLAVALASAGRHAESAQTWDRVIAGQSERYGAESAVVVASLLEAAKDAMKGRQTARAERLLAQAHAASPSLSETSRTRASTGLHLGRFLLDAGRPREAVAPLREAVGRREILGRPGVVPRPGIRSDGDRAAALLGEALLATDRREEAQRLLTPSASALADSLGEDAPEVRRARAALARAR